MPFKLFSPITVNGFRMPFFPPLLISTQARAINGKCSVNILLIALSANDVYQAVQINNFKRHLHSKRCSQLEQHEQKRPMGWSSIFFNILIHKKYIENIKIQSPSFSFSEVTIQFAEGVQYLQKSLKKRSAEKPVWSP